MYFAFIFIAIGAVIIYGVVVMLEVPGLAKERLGELEPLPVNLNEWVIDRESDEAKTALGRGLQRETRLWQDPSRGFLGKERLRSQVRYRNLKTDEIDETEPDRAFRRRRVKA
jgi:hypothetical protein